MPSTTLPRLILAAGLGVVAALLFGALRSGSIAGVFLFYLAPLPLAVAGLAYGPLAALVAGLAGAAALGAALNASLAGVFMVALGAPVALLSYRVLRRGRVEVPGLLAWLGALSVGLIFLAATAYDTNHADYLARAASAFARVIGEVQGAGDAGLTREDLAATLARVAAPLAAAGVFSVLALNLWLAARLLDASGRLPVPRPSLPDELAVGRGDLLAAGGVGMLLELLPGWPGLAGSLVLAVLAAALALHGLAAAHALTRGQSARGPMLGAIYLFLLVISPPVLGILAMLGVADALFGLRARAARRAPRSPT